MVGEEAADVRERGATLFDRGDDRAEVVVQQHQVGRLAGHVGAGRAHGDPDVGGAQRRAVVHAVTSHRDDVSSALQCHRDAQLVRRRDAGDHNAVMVQQRSQFVRVGRQGRAFHDQPVGSEQTHLFGDGAGGGRVVTGDHGDADARGPARRDRLLHVIARRILQAHQAEELEVLFGVLPGLLVTRLRRPARHRQHAQPALSQCRDGVLSTVRRHAQRQYRFRRTGHVHAIGVHNGRSAAPGVERESRGIRRRAVLAHTCGEDVQGDLHRVADRKPPVVLVEHVGDRGAPLRAGGQFTHLLDRLRSPVHGCGRLVAGAVHGHLTTRRPHVHDRHLVARQRAGLVGADERRRSQRLHRVELAHQRVLGGHVLRRTGQRQRDGRQQPLRHERHRDADGEQEPFREREPEQDRDAEEDRAHHDSEHGDHHHDLVQLGREGAARWLGLLGQRGDARELRVPAGRGHQHRRLAFRDVGARVHLLPGNRPRRHALPSQHRLVDGQPRRGQHLAVGTDPRTWLQQQLVTGHQIGGVDLAEMAVPSHRGAQRHQVAQALRRAVGTVFLREREATVEHDHHRDRHGQCGHARDVRQHRSGPQHQCEEVHQLLDQQQQRVPPTRPRQHVRPVVVQSPRRLGRGKSRCRESHGRIPARLMSSAQGTTSLQPGDQCAPSLTGRTTLFPQPCHLDAGRCGHQQRGYLIDNANRGMSLAASWLTTTLFTLIVLGLVALPLFAKLSHTQRAATAGVSRVVTYEPATRLFDEGGLAASRALAGLAHQLLDAAAADVEQVAHSS